MSAFPPSPSPLGLSSPPLVVPPSRQTSRGVVDVLPSSSSPSTSASQNPASRARTSLEAHLSPGRTSDGRDKDNERARVVGSEDEEGNGLRQPKKPQHRRADSREGWDGRGGEGGDNGAGTASRPPPLTQTRTRPYRPRPSATLGSGYDDGASRSSHSGLSPLYKQQHAAIDSPSSTSLTLSPRVVPSLSSWSTSTKRAPPSRPLSPAPTIPLPPIPLPFDDGEGGDCSSYDEPPSSIGGASSFSTLDPAGLSAYPRLPSGGEVSFGFSVAPGGGLGGRLSPRGSFDGSVEHTAAGMPHKPPRAPSFASTTSGDEPALVLIDAVSRYRTSSPRYSAESLLHEQEMGWPGGDGDLPDWRDNSRGPSPPPSAPAPPASSSTAIAAVERFPSPILLLGMPDLPYPPPPAAVAAAIGPDFPPSSSSSPTRRFSIATATTTPTSSTISHRRSSDAFSLASVCGSSTSSAPDFNGAPGVARVAQPVATPHPPVKHAGGSHSASSSAATTVVNHPSAAAHGHDAVAGGDSDRGESSDGWSAVERAQSPDVAEMRLIARATAKMPRTPRPKSKAADSWLSVMDLEAETSATEDDSESEDDLQAESDIDLAAPLERLALNARILSPHSHLLAAPTTFNSADSTPTRSISAMSTYNAGWDGSDSEEEQWRLRSQTLDRRPKRTSRSSLVAAFPVPPLRPNITPSPRSSLPPPISTTPPTTTSSSSVSSHSSPRPTSYVYSPQPMSTGAFSGFSSPRSSSASDHTFGRHSAFAPMSAPIRRSTDSPLKTAATAAAYSPTASSQPLSSHHSLPLPPESHKSTIPRPSSLGTTLSRGSARSSLGFKTSRRANSIFSLTEDGALLTPSGRVLPRPKQLDLHAPDEEDPWGEVEVPHALRGEKARRLRRRASDTVTLGKPRKAKNAMLADGRGVEGGLLAEEDGEEEEDDTVGGESDGEDDVQRTLREIGWEKAAEQIRGRERRERLVLALGLGPMGSASSTAVAPMATRMRPPALSRETSEPFSRRDLAFGQTRPTVSRSKSDRPSTTPAIPAQAQPVLQTASSSSSLHSPIEPPSLSSSQRSSSQHSIPRKPLPSFIAPETEQRLQSAIRPLTGVAPVRRIVSTSSLPHRAMAAATSSSSPSSSSSSSSRIAVGNGIVGVGSRLPKSGLPQTPARARHAPRAASSSYDSQSPSSAIPPRSSIDEFGVGGWTHQSPATPSAFSIVEGTPRRSLLRQPSSTSLGTKRATSSFKSKQDIVWTLPTQLIGLENLSSIPTPGRSSLGKNSSASSKQPPPMSSAAGWI